MSNIFKSILLGGTAIVALSPGASFAQNGDEPQSDEGVVEEIVVSGIRSSLRQALDLKRDSSQFIDALVAEDFAQFPDANLSEALQRIPGITVDRSEGADQSNAIGEGGTINLRGLGSNFTRTEINSMTATTAGQQRGFGFNILASEVFAAAIVQKSLTAKDNEGGLAGTVNLRTYRPFDFDERVLSVSARGTYIDESEAVTPSGTAIFADVFSDGKLGFAAAINFDRAQPRDISVDALNFDFLRDRTGDDPAVGEIQYPRGPRQIENDREQNRVTATATLQARPSEQLTLTFDNIYAFMDHTGIQNRQGLAFLSGSSEVPTDIVAENNVLHSATFETGRPVSSLINYEYDIQTELYQGVLTAEWQVSEAFKVIPSLGYSTAEEDFRKWDQIILVSEEAPTVVGTTGNFTFYNTAAGNIADPTIYSNLFAVRNRPDRDQDNEFAARLDFEWKPNVDFITRIDFGGRWAEREKVFEDFDGRASIDTSITDFSPYIVANDFDFGGAPDQIPNQILGFDFDGLRNATGTNDIAVALLPEGSYQVTEETFAGYVSAHFEANRLTGNVGVRVVNTDQTSTGTQRVTSEDGLFELLPAEFSNDYTFALPSVNLRYDLTDNLVARASFYRSLTRPLLTDIQPARSIPNFEGGNGTAGNPELNPFTASNYDLGFEWYFAEGALVSFTYFHKDLNGLIERITEEVTVTDPVTNQVLNVFLSRPINGEDAKVDGFEIGMQAPFSFLPGILKHTGFAANATFTDSEATFINEGDLRTTTLPGLSEESFNLIAYYDDGRFASRLAYNWRGSYLLQVSGSGGQPVSRDDYGQLDFSSAFNVTDSLSITFDILNITGERIRSFSSLDERFPKSLLQFGRRFTLGVNVRF